MKLSIYYNVNESCELFLFLFITYVKFKITGESFKKAGEIDNLCWSNADNSKLCWGIQVDAKGLASYYGIYSGSMMS